VAHAATVTAIPVRAACPPCLAAQPAARAIAAMPKAMSGTVADANIKPGTRNVEMKILRFCLGGAGKGCSRNDGSTNGNEGISLGVLDHLDRHCNSPNTLFC